MRHGSCRKRYLRPPTAVPFSSVRAKEAAYRKKRFIASPSPWPPTIVPTSRGSRVVVSCSTGSRWRLRPNLCVPQQRCFCVKRNFEGDSPYRYSCYTTMHRKKGDGRGSVVCGFGFFFLFVHAAVAITKCSHQRGIL